MRDEEVESAQTDEIAPWLVNPESSRFYRAWAILISLVLQVELLCIPLVLAEKTIQKNFDQLFWTLDVIWVVNMLIKL